MTDTETIDCPKCGEDVDVTVAIEQTKVGVGVARGGLTVAEDRHIWSEQECDCDLSDYDLEALAFKKRSNR